MGRPTACQKHRIVCFENTSHGRTLGVVSATPNPKYQQPFEPLVPSFDVGEYNHEEGVNDLIREDTCAVIVEPIQGEEGLAVASTRWLGALGRRCDEVGAVLICDETQVPSRLSFWRCFTFWGSRVAESRVLAFLVFRLSMNCVGRGRCGRIRTKMLNATRTSSPWGSRSRMGTLSERPRRRTSSDAPPTRASGRGVQATALFS